MSVAQATELLVLRLQRREITSSRTAALETAQLLYRFVGSAKYATIEALLEQIRVVGRRLVRANAKELAVGNIVRKILKLIREEYRVALASFLAQQPDGSIERSTDPAGSNGTEDVASPQNEVRTIDSLPPTPGINAPTGHFLNDEYLRKAGTALNQSVAQQAALQHALSILTLGSPKSGSIPVDRVSSEATPSSPGLPSVTPTTQSPSRSTSSNNHPNSRPALQAHATLSNFVQMRHDRAQLERAGSTTNLMGMGIDGILDGFGLALGGAADGGAQIQSQAQGSGPGAAASDEQQRDRRQSHSRRTSFPGLLPIAGNAMSTITGSTSNDPPTSSATSSQQRRASKAATSSNMNSSTASQLPPSTSHPTLQRVQTQRQRASEQFAKKAIQLKPVLVDAIREVVDEIETTHETCARGAREHIHSSEIILTIGASRTVEAFLKAAWKDRNFTVFITESAPSYQGRTMAKNLARHGIHTILVPDSSAYALMPRVTKVIFGAHTVLANGGVFAIAGALVVALAAQAHATPVVVVSGQYKFAPAWNLNHEFAAVDFVEPEGVLSYAEGDLLDHVEVGNPFYDYIRPELINLFITNEGDHSPSYLYKIIKEAYDDEDLDL